MSDQQKLTPTEQLQLIDLIQSDGWQLVKRISEVIYQGCLEALVGISESGNFHQAQGTAYGVKLMVTEVERLAKPDIAKSNGSGVDESSLNARKL